MEVPSVIVVATDFSEPAGRAVEQAIDLAERFGAKLHIAHLFTPPLPFAAPYDLPPPQLYLDEARKQCDEKLEACRARAAERGVAAEAHLLSGVDSHQLTELAEELEADMLVVGTRGLTGVKHVLLGSIAERIVRHAPCSVMVVR